MKKLLKTYRIDASLEAKMQKAAQEQRTTKTAIIHQAVNRFLNEKHKLK